MTRRLSEAAEKMMKGEVKPTLPFDPFAIAQATSEFALGDSLLGPEFAEALGLPRDSARSIAAQGLRAEIEARHPKS